MKPRQFPARTPTLFSFFARPMEVAITSLLVALPRTISSNFITLAGLKKWWPMTIWGRLVAEAISSMLRVEVFDARMQSGFGDLVQITEDLFLERHALENRFDDDIGLVEAFVIEP